MSVLVIHGCGICPAKNLCCACNHAPPVEGQVAAARDWIRNFARPIKSFSSANSSYGLKHAVERWFRLGRGAQYVSNGAFIEAAIREGYRWRPTDDGSPNAHFNMRILKAGWTR